MEPLAKAGLKVECRQLHVPDLREACEVIRKGLSEVYQHVEVDVVPCPDLSKAPFDLAAKGICGQQRILDVGGVPYLIPLARRDKLYDLRDLPSLAQMEMGAGEKALIIGAAAAPWTFLNRNAEMMPNLAVDDQGRVVCQKSRVSRTFDEDGSSMLIDLPAEETKMSLLGNLHLSKGEAGQEVIEIRCQVRKSDANFVSCIRHALQQGFPGKCVGLGGTFCAVKGKVKVHVMPDYSPVPLESDEAVDRWLQFYEMDSAFTCLSVLISNDPGLDLRLEHSHGSNPDKNQGGHYHIDTTPDIIEYHAYYGIAEACYRVDRPEV